VRRDEGAGVGEERIAERREDADVLPGEAAGEIGRRPCAVDRAVTADERLRLVVIEDVGAGRDQRREGLLDAAQRERAGDRAVRTPEGGAAAVVGKEEDEVPRGGQRRRLERLRGPGGASG